MIADSVKNNKISKSDLKGGMHCNNRYISWHFFQRSTEIDTYHCYKRYLSKEPKTSQIDDKKWKAKQKRLRKTIDTTAKFSPVNAYIKQHYEETGEWLSYGKEVVLLEQKKGRSRK